MSLIPPAAANRRPAALFSTVFGVLMVAAAARPAGPWGLAALALTAAALAVGVFIRPASVVAVLLTVAGIALADPIPLLAGVSGLAAAAYLVGRYADEVVTLTVPSVLGMVGFAAAGVAATAVSVEMTWVPLVAPAVMAAILILVAAPLVSDLISGPAADRDPPG